MERVITWCLQDKWGHLAESIDVKVRYKPGVVNTSSLLLEEHLSSQFFLAIIALELADPTLYHLVHISRYIEFCGMFVYFIPLYSSCGAGVDIERGFRSKCASPLIYLPLLSPSGTLHLQCVSQRSSVDESVRNPHARIQKM